MKVILEPIKYGLGIVLFDSRRLTKREKLVFPMNEKKPSNSKPERDWINTPGEGRANFD